MEVISIRESIARKDHKCSYCNSIILKGEKYESQFCVDSGAYTWKSHLDCSNLSSKLFDRDEFLEGVSDRDFQAAVYEKSKALGFEGSFKERLSYLKGLLLIRKENIKNEGNKV